MNPLNHSFYFTPTNQFEILDITNLLDSNKATNIYNFPISVIKQVSDLISPVISHLINISIQKSIFPNKLKVSKIIPLFKSGAKNDIKNYRPISILPIFDKVIEKIVHQRLISCLTSFNILTPTQFGFQENKSTSHAVLNLIIKI